MADPTKPDIEYDYVAFQQEQQDSPFPGTQLQNDLENLADSVGVTIDAVKDVRRSDGKLKNGIVTEDSLGPGLSKNLVVGMKASIYDPDTIGADVFDMDNMKNGVSLVAMTAAERTKLTGVEAGATADQTGAEIKSLYEAEGNTNAFTDSEKTKLTGIESGATANSSDAALLARANHTGSQAISTVTGLQSALDGKQPLVSILTQLAGLTPNDNDVLQQKGGSLASRTMAQLKTDLGLVKGDVGLGNVDNTSDANKPVSTAQQTALDGKMGTNFSGASGAIPNANLPARLQQQATTITDWNNATDNGWYRANGGSNAPTPTGWYTGYVETTDVSLWITQTVHAALTDSSADPKIYRRERNSGTWGSWYRIDPQAFGWGAAINSPPNNDLDDIDETGVVLSDGSTANRPGGAGFWSVLTARNATSRTQIAFSRTSSDIRYRYYVSGAWNPWAAVMSGGSGSNDAIVTSTAALRALDTTALSVAIYDGYIWNLVATSGVSALVTADTQRGVYAESTDDTDFTWVRQHNGVITPEMFGATAVTNFASPSDSTTALAGLVSLVNALALPVEIRLRGHYMTTDTLALATEALSIRGLCAGDSGFIFDPSADTKLMTVTQTTMQSTVVLEDISLLCDSDNLHTAFEYVNTRSGGVPGNAFKKEITRCASMGLYRYRKLRHGAGAGDDQGWLKDFVFDEGDGFYMKRCLIEGNENDRTVGAFFPQSTVGVDVTESTHFVMEDCGINFKADAVKGTGSMEALEMTRNHLVLNRRGVTLASSTAPANDHNIIQNHINSFEHNLDLYYGSTITPRMFTIQGNLLFATAAGTAGQAGDTQGFCHIRGDFAASQVFGNHAYTEAGVDPTSGARDHRFLLLGGGDYNMAFGNIVEHIQTIFELEAGTVGTMIFGNMAWDNPAGSSGTIATTDTAILDNGSDNYQWFNGGVRKGGWGAPRLPIQQLAGHADDTAASGGGVPIGGLYRTGSTLKIRVT